jgi:hypothetical protein
MDYFESIVKTLLEQDGYWVRQSFKVNLSKEEKRKIGKPSIPRPEIDLLAFKPAEKEVLVIEVKSLFDSYGVRFSELRNSYAVPTGRYKLFTCSNYKSIVFNRLKADLVEQGLISKDIKLRLGLAAGKVYQSGSPEITKYFKKKSWYFLPPEEIKNKVIKLASVGYENEPSIITAKILTR